MVDEIEEYNLEDFNIASLVKRLDISVAIKGVSLKNMLLFLAAKYGEKAFRQTVKKVLEYKED